MIGIGISLTALRPVLSGGGGGGGAHGSAWDDADDWDDAAAWDDGTDEPPSLDFSEPANSGYVPALMLA